MKTLDSIKHRHTIKAISDTPLATKPADKAFIETLIEASYWAPFHKPCQTAYQNGDKSTLSSIMPWRFYILDSTQCREFVKWLKKKNIAMGKIEGMLNSADYLIQATWTPDKHDEKKCHHLFDGSLDNMEHIAAASAAIQNLLLTATSLGINNYWSSGGVLRDKKIFKKLNISRKEILLGSLFLFPSNHDLENNDTLMCKSKLRDKRGDINNSFCYVDSF